MREFKLDYTFRVEARATYDSLGPIQQSDIALRVDFLCQQPEPDEIVTFEWPEEGPSVFIYFDEAWLIIYSLVDEWRVVEVWTIAPAGRLHGGR